MERLTREEIEGYTWKDPDSGEVFTGWKALRRRAFLIAMHGEARDALPAIKWLHDRAFGQAKQSVELSGDASPGEHINWDAVPLEERRKYLELASALGALATPESNDTEH